MPVGLKPHDDLLAEFPYLGPPNPYLSCPRPAHQEVIVQRHRGWPGAYTPSIGL